MNGIPTTPPSPSHPMSRSLLFSLLDAAFRTGELRYARRLSTAWLAAFPGDLEVKFLLSRAYYKENSSELKVNALPILEELCKLDPEYLEAQDLLSQVGQLAGAQSHLVAKACANALTHGMAVKTGTSEQLTTWAKYVYDARIVLSNLQPEDEEQIEIAEASIHKALVENPDTPLAAVIHLRLIQSKTAMPKMAVRSLAEIYHERWPECIQFLLTLANELMESGDSSQAVKLLHQAVSNDINGQVPRRMWGDNHQYASLWPDQLEATNSGLNSPQNIPVPAAIASYLGWNQIAAMNLGSSEDAPSDAPTYTDKPGSINYDSTIAKPIFKVQSLSGEPEAPRLSPQAHAVQTELERMADELKRPHLVREDGRFPIYVIFTTRRGLEAQYDPPACKSVDLELKKLASVIHGCKINQEYWGSLLFYADDPACTQQFNLKPAPYNDPWQLKLLLADLDTALEKRGERIGSLLIVGGPEIVPFHNLPNPVEDADNDVPSDNPYAAKDGNYFICDWPVGRVSGGSGDNPNHLLAIIKDLIFRYDPQAKKQSWLNQMILYIQEFIRKGLSKKQSSYGYTAAVWRRASLAVFRSIGTPDDMLISPPTHACDSQEPTQIDPVPMKVVSNSNACLLLPRSHLGYFNLHGIPDGSEWYGQSDPALPEVGPDFPVAMRPADIKNSGSAPRLVFTEACYGTNITGKLVDEAISLKFLSSGTQAVIGSTCISYGSLTVPLSSADLLGRVFWSLLQEGFTAGESLRRAKIHLTREMHNRQGFLDAEDQKTLISFILVGDPLAQPFHSKTSPKTTPHLSDNAVPVPTVCEHSCQDEKDLPVSLETISHLKSVVSQYLPSMNDADVSLSQERQNCTNQCGKCKTGKKNASSQGDKISDTPRLAQRRIVTLSKNYERANYIHKQYARLTLDERGKIIKMVVSH